MEPWLIFALFIILYLLNVIQFIRIHVNKDRADILMSKQDIRIRSLESNEYIDRFNPDSIITKIRLINNELGNVKADLDQIRNDLKNIDDQKITEQLDVLELKIRYLIEI